MSIRNQLLLGNGRHPGLGVATRVDGYIGCVCLQTGIQKTLQEASQIRNASSGSRIASSGRQDEANFVASWPSLGMRSHTTSMHCRMRSAEYRRRRSWIR